MTGSPARILRSTVDGVMGPTWDVGAAPALPCIQPAHAVWFPGRAKNDVCGPRADRRGEVACFRGRKRHEGQELDRQIACLMAALEGVTSGLGSAKGGGDRQEAICRNATAVRR